MRLLRHNVKSRTLSHSPDVLRAVVQTSVMPFVRDPTEDVLSEVTWDLWQQFTHMKGTENVSRADLGLKPLTSHPREAELVQRLVKTTENGRHHCKCGATYFGMHTFHLKVCTFVQEAMSEISRVQDIETKQAATCEHEEEGNASADRRRHSPSSSRGRSKRSTSARRRSTSRRYVPKTSTSRSSSQGLITSYLSDDEDAELRDPSPTREHVEAAPSNEEQYF